MTDERAEAIIGPHRDIPTDSPTERWTCDLFDRLWDRYRSRVSYVADYERVVAAAGATFVNDHIAFRTLATQSPATGIHGLARIFDALGYRAAGCYSFVDKHLSAIHFQHPNPQFPKLFISELKTWELPAETRNQILSVVHSHRPLVDEEVLNKLTQLSQLAPRDSESLLTEVADQFESLPWNTPQRDLVQAVNLRSQYGAWVLVHGYNVNHFTSLVNSHGVATMDDIEKTIDALVAARVPMKKTIEGDPGSKLRQSATEAVMIDVEMAEGDQIVECPWSYAYFELAERNDVVDAATGKPVRFEGFLGPQATQLFEMTRVKSD